MAGAPPAVGRAGPPYGPARSRRQSDRQSLADCFAGPSPTGWGGMGMGQARVKAQVEEVSEGWPEAQPIRRGHKTHPEEGRQGESMVPEDPVNPLSIGQDPRKGRPLRLLLGEEIREGVLIDGATLLRSRRGAFPREGLGLKSRAWVGSPRQPRLP